MRTVLRWAPAIALGMAVLACNLPGLARTSTPVFNALETAAQQTLSARLTQGVPTATGVPPSATLAPPSATPVTPTSIPPTIILPTQIQVPPTPIIDYQATFIAQSLRATQIALAATQTAAVPPPRPVAGRIRFAAGATSGQAGGYINGGAVIDYLLAAGGGQTMLASVYSPNNDVFLGVSGVADGRLLLRTAAGQSNFNGVLPASQDYRLTLAAPPQGSSYTLQVIIPARIQFAPGAISAAIPGQLAGGEVNYYLANARQGQTMTVRILSPNSDIFLTIYGMIDGSPLVRSVMAQTTWSGILPLTQDYMIQAVSTGTAAGYSLEITIQ